MIMKKLFTLVAVLTFASTVCMAQPDPKEMVARQIESYKSALTLTAEQTPKVEAFLLVQAEKMGKMFEQGPDGDREAMMANMKKMQEENTAKFKEILTADQFAKYQKMMEERRANRPQMQ